MSRIIYIDLIRVLAVFAVVVTHEATNISREYELTNAYWGAGALWYCLSRFCVPVFVMASGALVLGNYRSEGAVRRFAGATVKKLLLPLLAWSFLYYIDNRVRRGDVLDPASFPGAVLTRDQAGHLWFLYMFAGLYLCVPLLAAMWRGADRRLKALFAVCWIYSAVNAHLAQWGLPTLKFSLPISPVWIGYFILGHELHQARERLEGARAIAWGLVVAGVSVLLMLGEMLLIRHVNPPPVNSTLHFGGLPVIAYSAAVWVLVMNVGEGGGSGFRVPGSGFGKGEKSSQPLSNARSRGLLTRFGFLGVHAYGIYLVHALFRRWFDSGVLGFTLSGTNLLPGVGGTVSALIMIPLASLAVFIPSALAAWALSRSRLTSWLVGR